jgi:two-component system, OmpR family, alkaline phosphatase synthesis response regulator PhoP
MSGKILVVDDDKAILELLRFELSSQGYEVVTAQNRDEFRAKALSEKPDLVILDIMLGSYNGAILYDEILGEGFDRRIPVIFLTALAQDRPPSPASPGRTYALYSKPFDPQQLLEEIGHLVNA